MFTSHYQKLISLVMKAIHELHFDINHQGFDVVYV